MQVLEFGHVENPLRDHLFVRVVEKGELFHTARKKFTLSSNSAQ